MICQETKKTRLKVSIYTRENNLNKMEKMGKIGQMTDEKNKVQRKSSKEDNDIQNKKINT